MACKDCLNRREFLTKTALGAAALAIVEGWGDGQFGPTGVTSNGLPPGGHLTIKVSDFPGLATVGQLVALPNASIGVIRTGASTFAATPMNPGDGGSNICCAIICCANPDRSPAW